MIKLKTSLKNPYYTEKGYLFVDIDREEIVKAAQFVKDYFKDSDYYFSEVFGTDLPDTEQIEIIYRWWEINNNLMFAFRVVLPYSDLRIQTITHIYDIATWFEREIWEMLGVEFEGHPSLEQFLLPDELVGKYPMRKAFKLRER